MKITETIIDLLKVISNVSPQQTNQYLISDNSIKLLSGNNQLIEINNDQLILGKYDITEKLIAKTDRLNKPVNLENFTNFIHSLSDSFIRLNHIGVSYAVSDFDSEIVLIKNIISETGFNLYEEPSEDKNGKWLFVGNTINWQSPLFEIVLTKDIVTPEDIWRPHFQIDIDTNLEQEKLEDYLINYFGKDFIQWKLDIPDYGVVLEMGMLGSINGSKIYLGVGTNLRDTKVHRKELLQEVL